MSFLTPLYILGALAVAAPIVFHLIRRTPRAEVPFSSLIFLSPSPPRLTRRSRLDHWLLLLLRAAALILLAVAFARPFLRQAAGLSLGDAEQRRIAVLIDTSASMRRGDLWEQAKARAVEAIEACRPGDQLAVFAFDAASRPVLGFDESATLDPSRRQAVAKALVERLTPSWGATHLGQALIDAAGAIENVGDVAARSSSGPAPDRPDQRPPAGQPARRARRLRMALGRGARSEDGRHGRLQRRARSGSPGRTRASRPPTGAERPPRAGLERRDFEDGVVRPGLDRRQGPADPRLCPPRREPRGPRAPARRRRAGAVPPAPGRYAGFRQHPLPRVRGQGVGHRPLPRQATPPTIRRACSIISTASSRTRRAAP